MDGKRQTGNWRQGLWNWLALAALLALGVVLPPDAPPVAPRLPAAAHAERAPLPAAHAHARVALR